MSFSIKNLTINEIEVMKSRFICVIFPINNVDDFNNELNKLKKENNKAKHFCYAYKIDSKERYSDDGEPKGSAGMPLLDSIRKKDLNYIGVIVIRYFGGTLLGSGRLLRTYLEAFEKTLENSILIEIQEYEVHKIECDYDVYDIFNNFLLKSHFIIRNKDFNDKIFMEFITPINTDIDYQNVFLGKVQEISKETKKGILSNE